MLYSNDCPYCGEALRPSEPAQLRCEACGAVINAEEVRVQSEEEILGLLREPQKEEADRGGFVCGNCGAQLIAQEETAASAVCCCCGAPALMPSLIRGTVEPELILPFAIDRYEAQSRFVHWFGAKKLIPPGFLRTAKTSRISGLYVPFWLFDCAMETNLHAVSVATETERNETGETVAAASYQSLRRVATAYQNVPADASERIDGRLMNLLGPFDLSRLEPFDPAFLDGCYAEKHSFSAEQLWGERVRGELEADSLRAARESLMADRFAEVKTCRRIYTELSAKYALLPVWLMTHHENGYTHQFFMNGQTGKIVGEAPLSAARAIQWFGGVTAAVAAAGELLWIAIDKFLK